MSGNAILNALVMRGTRNLFTVMVTDTVTTTSVKMVPGAILECRIKGKVLKGMEDYYNPLAPGDRVSVELDPLNPGTGMITSLEERRNVLTRFNQKGQKSQALAANIDLALCMTTPLSPPFRPRFLDRLLVQAEISGITPLILCNKWDLFAVNHNGGSGKDGDTLNDSDTAGSAAGTDDTTAFEERLADYRRIGYRVLYVSAKTGFGMEELRAAMAGKSSALLGQSGVGKSSLVNALAPELSVKTGAVNEKYDRGNHTTALSVMMQLPGFEEETFLIDTPGIRRMVPDGIKTEDVPLYMKEFAEYAGRCAYGLSCSHRSEQGCKILEAADKGLIHKDRYESFLRIGDELAAL